MCIFRRLADWQALYGVDDAELAAKIGVHRSVISRARRGITVPRIEHQLAIQDITGIKPEEWAEFRVNVIKSRTGAQKKTVEAVA